MDLQVADPVIGSSRDIRTKEFDKFARSKFEQPKAGPKGKIHGCIL
jgi:hypothetical protein